MHTGSQPHTHPTGPEAAVTLTSWGSPGHLDSASFITKLGAGSGPVAETETNTPQISLRVRGGCWRVKGDTPRERIWSSTVKGFETDISSAYTSTPTAGKARRGW